MVKKGSSTIVVASAVGGNFSVSIAKFVGWFLTGSPSMLAESIHSLADTCNQALLLVGIRHGRLGESPEYPWGRSSATYLWNLISAMGIFFVGFGVTTYHGVASLLSPHESHAAEHRWTLFGILAFAFVVEVIILVGAYREVARRRGKRGLWNYIMTGDDPTSVAVLLEDAVAVLGVLLAALGVWVSSSTGSSTADSITSIVIGCLLGFMAVVLAYANGRLLVGAAPTPQEVEAIKAFLEGQPSVEKVLVLKTRIGGPGQVRIAAEVEFHGSALIDRERIKQDANLLRDAPAESTRVLADTAERMVRVMGNEINRIERELYEAFPRISAIELEVN